MLDLECTVLLVKMAKCCSACKDCEKSSEKSEHWLLLLDTILDVDELLLYFKDDEQYKSIAKLMIEIADLCLKCNRESAIVHEKVSNYLEKFGNIEMFTKKGNVVFLPFESNKIEKN